MATKALAPILVTALAASTLPLAGCKFFERNFDHKDMEQTIQKDAGAQGLHLASVTCPEKKPMKQGTKFDCKVTDKRGTQGDIDVTATNDQGGYEWKLRHKFMKMEAAGDSLEEMLSKKLGEPVDVVCPPENILIKKGITFTCDVKIGKKTEQIKLTAKDDDGKEWDEKIITKG
jgi:hypothetical protein